MWCQVQATAVPSSSYTTAAAAAGAASSNSAIPYDDWIFSRNRSSAEQAETFLFLFSII
jgi:hypothetical protein